MPCGCSSVVQVAQPAAVAVEACLPGINSSCRVVPAVSAGVSTVRHFQLPTEYRETNTYDNDVQTVVRENNNHTTYNKNVVTTVNRNHVHTQRIVDNHNQHNTYVTNKVVKVNDIHRQRVEHVPGEKRVYNKYKQTQVVEPAKCVRADGRPCHH